MLWEIEIAPRSADLERQRVHEELALLTGDHAGTAVLEGTSRGYLIEGNLSRQHAERLLHELLVDPLIETGHLTDLSVSGKKERVPSTFLPGTLTVLPRPGVMDPVALSLRVGAGKPEADTVKLPAWPTVRAALLELVKAGAWLTVRVKLCVALPAVLVAVKVRL